MTQENHQTLPLDRPSQLFSGIRFVLLGFEPIKKDQVSFKLVCGGAVNVDQYGPNCTHVIVDKLLYDDPVCVAARRDEKILVSSLWVDRSFDVDAPVDTTLGMYMPARDLNGVPGAKSLVICVTGSSLKEREDVMTMVELMGAQYSGPLLQNKVTHLICYKFEGEKYQFAKRKKNIKLINRKWLDDCLKAWDILREADYSESGYGLKMAAKAKDSEEEPQMNQCLHDIDQTNDQNDPMSIKCNVIMDKSAENENLDREKTSTPNQARGTKRKNDLDRSVGLQVIKYVCNDADKDIANADEETEKVVNRKESKRNKCSSSETKVSAKEVAGVKALLNKKGKRIPSRRDLEARMEIMERQLTRMAEDFRSLIEHNKAEFEERIKHREEKKVREDRKQKAIDYEFFIRPHNHLCGRELQVTLQMKEEIASRWGW